jgi:hypothetical protein
MQRTLMKREEKQNELYCVKYKKKVPFDCSLCVFEKKCMREKHILANVES